MLQAWLVVSPPSIFHTFSTVIFFKDGGENDAVTNFMSHFSMFFQTKATVKMANVNMVHTQGIGFILCCFTNCSVIYPVVPVYYCPRRPSKTISLGALKFMLVFKRLHMNLLNIVTLLTLKVFLGNHPTRLKTISTIFKSKLSKSTLKETEIFLSQK